MVKKFFILVFLFVGISVSAETLRVGVSKIADVPNTLYGNWRVVSKIDKQEKQSNFRPQAIDFWNLSRIGDVINLNNPFTGASATVKLDYVEGDVIRFSKISNFEDNTKLIENINLKLEGDKFSGINYIKLEKYSIKDNSLVERNSAVYILKGEKIYGTSITE